MKATWEERGEKKKSTTKQAFTESCLKVMEGKVHGFCCFFVFVFFSKLMVRGKCLG